MEKVLNIEGMVCMNCVKHVDKALREIQGIREVSVSLENKSAQVQLNQDVPDEVLKAAIEDAGYQVVGILQMIEEDRYCVDISTQLQSVQALLKSVNQQILQAHIRNCVREALQTDAENPKLEEALKLLEKMAR